MISSVPEKKDPRKGESTIDPQRSTESIDQFHCSSVCIPVTDVSARSREVPESVIKQDTDGYTGHESILRQVADPNEPQECSFPDLGVFRRYSK